MNYPHLKIVSDSRIMGSIILFYESETAEPIDISGVVQTIEVRHTAGDIPECKLTIPLPILDMQVEALRTTIDKIIGEVCESPTPTQEDV